MSEEIIQKVGQYEVEEFRLQNNYGHDPIILSNFMVEMTIYEDIFSPYMHGSILIADSSDIINGLGIHGGESITIKFRTTTLEDQPSNIFFRTFIVYAITNRGMINDRQQTYTLKFCSPEGYDDQTKPMAGIQNVTGFYDHLRDLFNDNISGGRDRTEDGGRNPLDVRPWPQSMEFAYMSNNWSPVQNMMYLTKFAKNEDGIPDYLFFESSKGYYFRSLSEMIESQKAAPFDQYTYVQEGQPPVSKEGESLSSNQLPPKFSQFNEIDIPRTIDVLEGQASGQYASNTMMVDLFSKERQTIASDVRGDMSAFKKTDTGLGVPAFVPRNSLQKTIMMYGNSILNTTNKVGFGVLDGAYVQGAGGYSYAQAFRRQYLYSFKDYSFEVIVPGRTDIEVGKLIKLVYPKGTSKAGIEDQDEAIDPILSGNYLITSIAHRFKPTDYTMNMNIVKNGLLEQAGPTEDEMNVSYDAAGGG